MARVEIVRCDRCGRFDEDDEAATVTVTVDDGVMTQVDLCGACREGLDSYIGGRKLARRRKAAK